MFKNLFSTAILSFLTLNGLAQITLTHKTNGLVIGESCKYNEIDFVDAGQSGPNQVWNFTQIKYSDKSPVVSYQTSLPQTPEGINNSNLSILDDGYSYIMQSRENSLEELGYVNSEKNMNMVYSDPILKMKYPLTFGDTYSDPFSGVAYFDKTYKIDFTGEYTINADAYGTLLLPNLVLQNVMRVKTVKSGIQVNPCGQIKVNIVKYAWYAEGYRYPVLILNTVENTYYNGLNPEIKTTALVLMPQSINMNDNVLTNNQNITIKSNLNSNVTVNLFPNPFSEKVSYNYLLKSDMPVSIALFDVTGKYNEQIANNEFQKAGFHSGDIDELKHQLAAGVYYIRFTFGEQVVVQKMVKLEAQ